MSQVRELSHIALESMTDYFWSPLNIFRIQGATHPHGLTPGEVWVCKGLSLAFSGTRMGGVIQFLYGPEARNMYEENLEELKEEQSLRS